ncbi:acyloxyacyl hydrolase [Shinella sp. BYT-45]|uniref:acyloxyacyl hydrolase n=1 Tax=Shinella sp. BYT-45 TaxID=3377377 RepID=UPI0039800ACC
MGRASDGQFDVQPILRLYKKRWRADTRLDDSGDAMKIFLAAALAAVSIGLHASPAAAGDLIDEVRVGVSGGLNGGSSEDKGVVGSAEVYIAPFQSSQTGLAKVLLEPRVQVGVSGGADATDQAYLGLNWHLPITETLFAEVGAGGTVHNGSLDSGPGPLLGCRFLFREHAALGVRVTDNVSVMATVDHSSSADLCDGPNDGLTHAGLSVGVKF